MSSTRLLELLQNLTTPARRATVQMKIELLQVHVQVVALYRQLQLHILVGVGTWCSANNSFTASFATSLYPLFLNIIYHFFPLLHSQSASRVHSVFGWHIHIAHPCVMGLVNIFVITCSVLQLLLSNYLPGRCTFLPYFFH